MVDESIENRANQSEEQFRYSSNKFYRRKDEFPKSDDKNDKRRDQFVILDLDKYYCSLKQVVYRLSSIYSMVDVDTNFDCDTRAKLVS
ncbi:MAG: hypothetical protein J6V67_02975 [Campylobacter sp.]|uniref:hypothetical protein n=1 Tax=Campylobacter sp. TaxID=205 RepID=UPI001B11F999|nr:hypothetical protein [Campylobacter sp.]MBO7154835.1 hypothetical protein [Campylobacter sp.]